MFFRPANTVKIKRGTLRGFARPGYEELLPESISWADVQAKRPVDPDVQVAKRSRSRLVVAVPFRGETLYIKRALARTFERKVSAVLLGPKTYREWRMAERFRATGVIVPEPLFYARRGQWLSWLATRGYPESWLPMADLFEARGLSDNDLQDLGALTRELHGRQVFHGDWRTDHIYRTGADEDAPLLEKYALLDLDGARCGRPVTEKMRDAALRQLLQSLMRAGLTEPMAELLIRAYDAELDASPLFAEAQAAYVATQPGASAEDEED
ncbi:MAG: lipopolysaccharide kinase InaA family protein [Sumerlaeia bacterium]